ncbi:hypothetical protein [Novosphingobium clariflavum]|uniref:Uncharacterized protein n=1 Tax=Novosphingobium clariflavum TaxID=2029884 RepID=A0ABV6S1F1_9SPHN|nr:hypothetical protein [Novosphingobium clariflavum]
MVLKIIGRRRRARRTTLGPMSAEDRYFWDEMDRRRKVRRP